MQTDRARDERQRTSLAFIVDALNNSQLTWEIIDWANRKCDEEPLFDFTVFYEELAKPCLIPLFAVMPTSEMYLCEGPLVATSLSTARKLAQVIACRKKFFLIWDLEWTRKSIQYNEAAQVYQNPELTLLARSESHANLISKAWNREVKVCQIKEVIDVVGK